MNWYAYCNCDPVNFVDSNGESTKRKNSSPWLEKKSYVPNGDPIASFENGTGSYWYVMLAKIIFDASDIDTLGEVINSYNRIKRVSAKIHYARNRLNAVDLSIEEIVESWDLQSDFANSYHRNVDGNQGHEAKFNKKYLSPDGHYEVIICMPNDVVDEYAYIVDESVDPRNMGTYNFVSNDDPWYWIEHLIFDVMPYNMYGNTPDDTHGNKK